MVSAQAKPSQGRSEAEEKGLRRNFLRRPEKAFASLRIMCIIDASARAWKPPKAKLWGDLISSDNSVYGPPKCPPDSGSDSSFLVSLLPLCFCFYSTRRNRKTFVIIPSAIIVISYYPRRHPLRQWAQKFLTLASGFRKFREPSVKLAQFHAR